MVLLDGYHQGSYQSFWSATEVFSFLWTVYLRLLCEMRKPRRSFLAFGHRVSVRLVAQDSLDGENDDDRIDVHFVSLDPRISDPR